MLEQFQQAMAQACHPAMTDEQVMIVFQLLKDLYQAQLALGEFHVPQEIQVTINDLCN